MGLDSALMGLDSVLVGLDSVLMGLDSDAEHVGSYDYILYDDTIYLSACTCLVYAGCYPDNI